MDLNSSLVGKVKDKALTYHLSVSYYFHRTKFSVIKSFYHRYDSGVSRGAPFRKTLQPVGFASETKSHNPNF